VPAKRASAARSLLAPGRGAGERAGKQSSQNKNQAAPGNWEIHREPVTWELCRGNRVLALCSAVHVTPSSIYRPASLLSATLGLTMLRVKFISDSIDREVEKGSGGTAGRTGWGIFIPSTAARKSHSSSKFTYTLRVYGPGASCYPKPHPQIPEPAVTLERHQTHTKRCAQLEKANSFTGKDK